MGDVSSPTILPPSEPSCVSIAAGGILNATASSNSMDSPATGEVFSKSLPSDLGAQRALVRLDHDLQIELENILESRSSYGVKRLGPIGLRCGTVTPLISTRRQEGVKTINGHFPYTGCFPMVSQPLLDSLASVSTMSKTSKFLTSVCAKIDKIVRGFIWGSSALAHKISLVNWSAISQPRGRGGLGISCSNERNTTFMQKLAFSLVSSPDAILIMALRQKYRMINTCNGNDVHLWNDTWVPTLGLLRPWASSASTNIEHLRFEDLLLGDGQWNVGSLMDHVHQLVVPHIMGVLPPSLGATLYTVAWKLTLTGSFSVTSAYECMVESAWDALDFKWSRIWIGFAWASYFANAILVQSPPLQPMIDSFQWQVQSDSFVIVRLVLDPMAKTSSAPLFHAIALFFSRNWSIDFTWVPREQNMVVDSLSKLSPHPYYHLMLFDAVPEIIQPRP
ncbi:hypothetical protein V6N11_031032 [Hibiscus sabdariffa]|uniref:RNase H type-1 domain-containing protein n=1 Tax=Hibiscus sabdariffa TaxID=183260 RepID=A0ABR2ACG9_9ROSI